MLLCVQVNFMGGRGAILKPIYYIVIVLASTGIACNFKKCIFLNHIE